jgi:sulfur relay (sulfurtransferase) DsrC/TusE family protein
VANEADLHSRQADIERSIKFFEDVSLIEDCNEVAGKLLIEAEKKVSDLDQELKHLREDGDASLKYLDEYEFKVSRVSSELSYARKVAKTHTTTLAMFHEDAKHFGVVPPVRKLLAIMLTAQHRLTYS